MSIAQLFFHSIEFLLRPTEDDQVETLGGKLATILQTNAVSGARHQGPGSVFAAQIDRKVARNDMNSQTDDCSQ
ncbi:hypothetical protein TYRP_012539 [Tyrophagus putrescentiae]|nr:hypothetical protein TYRP_012539 [Tyrophagus putrescentiae]